MSDTGDDWQLTFPLRFAVFGTPVSLQSSPRSKEAWKATVKAALGTVISGHAWASEEQVSLTIYDFPSDLPEGDVDNIIKPIQDALIGPVYVDDNQVSRVVAQRFFAADYNHVQVLPDLVAEALVNDPPFVYIQINTNPFGDAQ